MSNRVEVNNLDLDVFAKFLADYILKNAPNLTETKEQPRTYEGVSRTEQNNYITNKQLKATTNL